MTLDEILEQSPDTPVYEEGKWAAYSVGCCWWTSFPEDLGVTPQKRVKFHKPDMEIDVGGIPCCPHCGNVLLQAPLGDFVRSAVDNPEHYGPGGLDTFVKAHSRNSTICHTSWMLYGKEIM